MPAAAGKGALNPQEFFTLLYLLDLYSVNHSLPDAIPPGVFPPGVHQCYSAAGLPVPGALQPSTVAHVPLAQQNPVENLAMAAESAPSYHNRVVFCCSNLKPFDDLWCSFELQSPEVS